MRIERKQKEREQLLKKLKQNGEHANNTSYNKQFRAGQLVDIIENITGYLYDDKKLFLKNEEEALLYLIRYISCVMKAKSARNKLEVRSALVRYQLLVESAIEVEGGNL